MASHPVLSRITSLPPSQKDFELCFTVCVVGATPPPKVGAHAGCHAHGPAPGYYTTRSPMCCVALFRLWVCIGCVLSAKLPSSTSFGASFHPWIPLLRPRCYWRGELVWKSSPDDLPTDQHRKQKLEEPPQCAGRAVTDGCAALR